MASSIPTFSEEQHNIIVEVEAATSLATTIQAAFDLASLNLGRVGNQEISRAFKECRRGFLRFLLIAHRTASECKTSVEALLLYAQNLQNTNALQMDANTLGDEGIRIRTPTTPENDLQLNLKLCDITTSIQGEIDVCSTIENLLLQKLIEALNERKVAAERAEQALRDAIPSTLKLLGINEASQPTLLYGSLAPIAFVKTIFGRKDPLDNVANLKLQLLEATFGAEDAGRQLLSIKEDQNRSKKQLTLKEALSSFSSLQENVDKFCAQLKVFYRIPPQMTGEINEIMAHSSQDADPAVATTLDSFFEFYTRLRDLIAAFCEAVH